MTTSTNPVTYAAYWNTPGYVPECEHAYFDTAAEAWEYLTDERNAAWNETEDMGPDYDRCMDEMSGLTMPGVVHGTTPGYDGAHDLGVAYVVTRIEGVVCVDCGEHFPTEDLAQAHWDTEHDR